MSFGSHPNLLFGHVPNPPPFFSVLSHSTNPSPSPSSNSKTLKSAFPNFLPQIPTLKNPSCDTTAMAFSGLAFNHFLATLPLSSKDSYEYAYNPSFFGHTSSFSTSEKSTWGNKGMRSETVRPISMLLFVVS